MEKFVPVVVIKELSETDKILTALKISIFIFTPQLFVVYASTPP